MSLLRLLVGFLRVLHSLPGQFVPAQVIAFVVMRHGGPMRMRGKFVKFGGSSVGIARHAFILAPACPRRRGYAVRIASDLSPEIAACAAANLAIGTRYGEQET